MKRYSIMKDNVALIELTHGTMHVLNQAQRQALFDALLQAEQDPVVQAVVIAGQNGIFSIGGDLDEFAEGYAFAHPHLCKDLFYLIEHFQKPVVAAMAGFALGGGLELAMVCHARVAQKGCLIGLPESKIGLIPGGQGTQRIIRALGIEQGLSLMLSGQFQAVEHFEHNALIQHVVLDEVNHAAVAYAQDIVEKNVEVKKLSACALNTIAAEPSIEFAKLQLKAYPHYNPALDKIIDVVLTGVQFGFERGCAHEAKVFAELINSHASLALRHLFFAEKNAQKVKALHPVSLNIKKVAVIGAGFMGQGIANCLSQAGLSVQLFDVRPEAASAAVKRIEQKAKKPVLIEVLEHLDDLLDVDLLIEAASENFEIKKAIFEKISHICDESVLLASNTSSLDLNALAQYVQHPERMLGMHFFGPVEHMKLLEIVQTKYSSEQSLIQAKLFAKKIEKIAVVAQVGPGFIGNRIFDAYLIQALNMVQQGISPARIDQVMKKWGMKMGPFQVMDLIGNDLLIQAWSDQQRGEGIDVLKTLVSAQKFGQKSQQGWYVYRGKNIVFDQQALSESLNISFVTKMDDAQIVQRLMLSLYVESMHVLDDGIAASKADIDLCFVHGYGFPATQGGPVFYIENQYSSALVQRQLGIYASCLDEHFWHNAKQKYVLEKIA